MSDIDPPRKPRSLYPLKFQPLLCLSAMFLAGIATGDLFSQSASLWIGITLSASSVALILLYRYHPGVEFQRLNWQKNLPLSPGWFLLLFAIGMLRLVIVQPGLTERDVAFHNENGKAAFSAVVVEPAHVKTHSTSFTVQTETIHPFTADFETGIAPVVGRMRVSTTYTGEIHYGDRVRIICTPETPQNSSDFNYQRYLAARKIYTTCDYAYVKVIGENGGNRLLKAIYDLRERAQTTINGILPPDEAALLSGILLGNEDHIAPEVETAFQRTGTSHIIAISGANFTVLISFITTLLLRYLPRKWIVPVSLVLIVVYTVMVGGNAAVVRAAIMGSLTVFGSYFGRRNQGLNALAFSGSIFVLINPLILWDLGFQLSFGATLGLVLFAEREKEILGNWLATWMPEMWAMRITNWVGEYALMTLSAQIFTLPLIAYNFRHISLSSFIINIFILPAQPAIMGIGGLATISGMLLPFLGQLLGWLAWIPLAYTLKIVAWGSTWSWSEIILPQFTSAALLVYFFIMTAWPLLLGWIPKIKKLVNQSAILLLVAGIVTSLWSTGLHQPVEEFQFYLFPLAESNAVLFQLPDGKAVLLGRSNSIDSLNHAIEEVLSGYQLSVFIQPDASWRALNRTENLTNHFPITDIFVNPEIDPEIASQLMTQLNRETNLHQLINNQTMQLMKGINLTTLTVRDESAAFLLEFGSLNVLLPNAITLSIVEQLNPDALQDTTILILNPMQMEAEVMQDWLRHPAQMTLINGEMLACDHCISTAEYGRIHLRSDGVGLWLDGTD